MEKWTRHAGTHALNICIANRDTLRKIVPYPNARRPFLGIIESGFIAAHGNRIDRQLIGGRRRDTMDRGIPGAKAFDFAVPSERDAGLEGAIRFVVRKLENLGISGIDRRRLTIHRHIGALEGRNANQVEGSCSQLESEYIRVRGHVLSNVIVRPAKPEGAAFSTRIRTRS